MNFRFDGENGVEVMEDDNRTKSVILLVFIFRMNSIVIFDNIQLEHLVSLFY